MIPPAVRISLASSDTFYSIEKKNLGCRIRTSCVQSLFFLIQLFTHGMCSRCFVIDMTQFELCSLSSMFDCAHLSGSRAECLSADGPTEPDINWRCINIFSPVLIVFCFACLLSWQKSRQISILMTDLQQILNSIQETVNKKHVVSLSVSHGQPSYPVYISANHGYVETLHFFRSSV